jgi:hypothetical protein
MPTASDAIGGLLASRRWPGRPDWLCVQDAFSEQTQLIRKEQQLVSQIFSTHFRDLNRQQNRWQYSNIMCSGKQQKKHNL